MSESDSADERQMVASSRPVDEPREVSDVRSLRALTHPVRIALLETLSLEGPLTATEAGERIGESPTTCSFHLRQLAKYGFVEEAGGGRGRSRPWRVSRTSMRIRGNDAASELAAAALGEMVHQRHLARFDHWRETRALYPKRWRDAASSGEAVIYMTPEEVEQVSGEFLVLMDRFQERLADPSKRPARAVPVEILTFMYPLRLPASDEGEEG